MKHRTLGAACALVILLGSALTWSTEVAASVYRLADQPAQLVTDEPDEPVAETLSPQPAGASQPAGEAGSGVAEGGTGEAARSGEPGQPALELKSPSAVLMEPLTGKVLFAKDADSRRAPASLTKVMTLLLAVEAIEGGRLALTDKVVTTENAESYGGTQIWLEVGEEMSVEDILMSIAVASANDASVALAEHMCGSEEEFVALMNERARELGMRNTHFVNSHGLDTAGHYSTARDMGLLSSEAVKHPELLRFTAVYETRIRGGETWLVNRNRMVTFYQGCDGLKTGWTAEAGYSVSVTAKRGGTRFVAVVMDAPTPTDRFADCAKMLNWAFANYTTLVVAEKGHPYGAVPVHLGHVREVEAVAANDQGVLLEKGAEGEVSREVLLSPEVKAPVRRGDTVGTIVVRRNGTELGRFSLVADRDVSRISYLDLWWRLYARVLGG